jgi:hypothetical protein
MDTFVRYLAREPNRPRMTEQERVDQLVNLVYGNVHVEHPAVTMDLVRKVVQERRAAGTMDARIGR